MLSNSGCSGCPNSVRFDCFDAESRVAAVEAVSLLKSSTRNLAASNCSRTDRKRHAGAPKSRTELTYDQCNVDPLVAFESPNEGALNDRHDQAREQIHLALLHAAVKSRKNSLIIHSKILKLNYKFRFNASVICDCKALRADRGDRYGSPSASDGHRFDNGLERRPIISLAFLDGRSA